MRGPPSEYKIEDDGEHEKTTSDLITHAYTYNTHIHENKHAQCLHWPQNENNNILSEYYAIPYLRGTCSKKKMDTSWDYEKAKCESLFYRYRTIGDSDLYNIVNAFNTAELAEQGQAKGFCRSRCKGTSDHQRIRPKPETSVGLVQARDLHGSRPKPANSTRRGWSQQP